MLIEFLLSTQFIVIDRNIPQADLISRYGNLSTVARVMHRSTMIPFMIPVDTNHISSIRTECGVQIVVRVQVRFDILIINQYPSFLTTVVLNGTLAQVRSYSVYPIDRFPSPLVVQSMPKNRYLYVDVV